MMSVDASGLLSALPLSYVGCDRSPVMIRTSRVLGNTLFCLDNSGALHIICSITMLPLAVWNEVRLGF